MSKGGKGLSSLASLLTKSEALLNIVTSWYPGGWSPQLLAGRDGSGPTLTLFHLDSWKVCLCVCPT